jgi:hypothetical protein
VDTYDPKPGIPNALIEATFETVRTMAKNPEKDGDFTDSELDEIFNVNCRRLFPPFGKGIPVRGDGTVKFPRAVRTAEEDLWCTKPIRGGNGLQKPAG